MLCSKLQISSLILLFFVSINDCSAFFAVVKVSVYAFRHIYGALALIVWTLHLLLSHSSKETVFQRLLLIAWACFAQRAFNKLFQHAAVSLVRQGSRLLSVVRETLRR